MSKHTPITVGVRVEELSHSTPEYDALWRRLLASTPYRSSVRYPTPNEPTKAPDGHYSAPQREPEETKI